MPTPRMKFNPGFRSDEEIVADFLVRHTDLDLVLRTIRENSGAPRNQHLLLVGTRGMGKTTLVLRAAAEVRSDPDLRAHWYPVVFSEESYSVSTPGEFWLEALDHLGHQTGDAQLRRAHAELRDERDEVRLRERALARLLDFADQHGKRLLFIVENLQMLLGDQLSSDDAWVLRETLQNEPRAMLLATATSRFQQIEDVHEAMYEQCLVHALKPLGNDECREFWERSTGSRLSGRQIRPIRILTGGNPRLLSIISSFAANSSFEELMTNLVQLVDDHTDYFKGHLDQLAAAERKVFVTLADIWDPAPARQVAAAARLEVSETSAQLGRLAGRGAVLSEGGKRTRKYQIAERMYNIYYLMRRRGDAAARVRALVRFMVGFYAPDELLTVTRAIAGEALGQRAPRAGDHAVLLAELRRLVTAASLRGRLDDIVAPVLGPRVSDATPAPTGAEAVLQLGEGLLQRPEAYREFWSEYRRAVAKVDDARAWAQCGRILYERSEFGEAEQVLRRALGLAPELAPALTTLGRTLALDPGRGVEAEDALRRATSLDPSDAEAWACLGFLLYRSGRPAEEAELAFRSAVKAHPDDYVAWTLLAQLLAGDPRRAQEAVDAADQCLVNTGRSLPALASLSIGLCTGGSEVCARAAEPWAREVAEVIEARRALGLLPLAFALGVQARWQEVLDLLREVLDDTGLSGLFSPQLTGLLAHAAAAGHGGAVLAHLQASPSAPLLEPLICALRLDAGEDVSVAQEIVEVARDILDDIHEAREKLAPSEHADAE